MYAQEETEIVGKASIKAEKSIELNSGSIDIKGTTVKDEPTFIVSGGQLKTKANLGSFQLGNKLSVKAKPVEIIGQIKPKNPILSIGTIDLGFQGAIKDFKMVTGATLKVVDKVSSQGNPSNSSFLQVLPNREQLQKEIEQYAASCKLDTKFQGDIQQLATLDVKLKNEPTNNTLQKEKTQLEEKLFAHPLYQQGMKLGMQAAQLRHQEDQKRDDAQINSMLPNGIVLNFKLSEASKHQQEADAIKEGCLVPLRQLFDRPNTPPLQRKASAFASGGVQSVKDTGEGFVGDVKFLDRLYDKIAASLATGEDKVGFQEGMVKAKYFYHKLVDEVKQDWENSEEYQERMQAARIIKQQIEAYELAFNAEDYHLKRAKDAGYVSAEVLQLVFGGEIIKGVGKELQVVGKGLKTVEGTKLLGQFTKFPNAAKKFSKHAHEFTSISDVNVYYNRAVKLSESKVGGSVHGFTSKEGWVFRFNSETAEFLTINPEGHIKTFFRPGQGFEYYLKQLKTYGN